MTRAIQAVRKEIARKEAALAALRRALALVTDTGAGTGRRKKRRPRTNAEKAALSKSMRASWRRRKAQEETSRKAAARRSARTAS